MKMELQSLNPGALFDYGGVRWAALNSVEDGVLCLAANTLFNGAFDAENRNNWAVSTLRAELNGELADKLKAGGADLQKFAQFRQFLTSNDGMKLYGSTIDGIALLTCEQYRKYRDIIPPATERWWTMTPYSCGEDYAAYVCAVNRDGTIDFDAACCDDWGVRPVCILERDTLVKVVPQESEWEVAALRIVGAVNGMAFEDACKALEKACRVICRTQFLTTHSGTIEK